MLNKVRDKRVDVGMSVSELARRARVSRQSIYLIENGTTKNVSGQVMLAIADALRCDEREIFFRQDVTHVLQTKKETA